MKIRSSHLRQKNQKANFNFLEYNLDEKLVTPKRAPTAESKRTRKKSCTPSMTMKVVDMSQMLWSSGRSSGSSPQRSKHRSPANSVERRLFSVPRKSVLSSGKRSSNDKLQPDKTSASGSVNSLRALSWKPQSLEQKVVKEAPECEEETPAINKFEKIKRVTAQNNTDIKIRRFGETSAPLCLRASMRNFIDHTESITGDLDRPLDDILEL